MESLTYFNIQRFCINDGPGIRTTVFLKGCPLSCAWCHNPESKAPGKSLFFRSEKCILCGACEKVCPNGCHHIKDGEHIFNRADCSLCGKCGEVCMHNALEIAGCTKSVDEILLTVLRDEEFYKTSGGGMTLSGGEPMLQFPGTLSLLKKAKERGVHTCMETCGFADAEKYKCVAKYTDIFLFDYKITDSALHRSFTGVSNESIRKNLYMLDAQGAAIILRCPIIPTVNDTDAHFEGIARTAEKLTNILEIHIEPYHTLGIGKAESLGMDYALRAVPTPENDAVAEWIKKISAGTRVPVRRA